MTLCKKTAALASCVSYAGIAKRSQKRIQDHAKSSQPHVEINQDLYQSHNCSTCYNSVLYLPPVHFGLFGCIANPR